MYLLAMQAAPAAPAAPARRSLVLRPAHHPERGRLEAFIGAIYARRYGASIGSFAPMLVGLRSHELLVAAAGYRGAGSGPLYLEHYLDEPVEAVLSRHAHTPVRRASVVEVGHLAAARSGEGLALIRLLAAHLASEGYEWVVGTVTRELRPALQRLDTRPLSLAQAKPARLGEMAVHWGSYYDHDPFVVAVDLGAALARYAHRSRRRAAKP